MEGARATIEMGEPTEEERAALLAAEVSERPAPDRPPLPGVAAIAATTEAVERWWIANEYAFAD